VTADERLGVLAAVFAPAACERLLRLAGADPAAAVALARRPRRERLAALAGAARAARRSDAELVEVLGPDRPALSRLLPAFRDAGCAPSASGAALLRRLALDLLSR
jgi:hypothetical protein